MIKIIVESITDTTAITPNKDFPNTQESRTTKITIFMIENNTIYEHQTTPKTNNSFPSNTVTTNKEILPTVSD